MYLRRVKELREDSDTPQKVIAEYLGVKQNTYSDYENGKIKIPLEVFFKLADYYKVSLDYFSGPHRQAIEGGHPCSQPFSGTTTAPWPTRR